jgi:hypothetical protein
MVKFVGFAETPKPPEGAELVVVSATLQSDLSQDASAARLFAKTEVSRWLGAFTKYQLSIGGKLTPVDPATQSEVTFTSVSLPKQVTMISENFGELQLSTVKSRVGVELHLRFSRWVLPEQREAFESTAANLAQKIAAALEVSNGE